MTLRWLVGCVLVLIPWIPSSTAHAHPLRFGVLQLREQQDGQVAVSFRFSGTERAPTGVEPRLPPHCDRDRQNSQRKLRYGKALRWTIDCGRRGLEDARIHLDGLADRDLQVVVRVERKHGERLSTTLNGRRTSWRIPPDEEDAAPSLGHHLRLGFEHILAGADHLLFVLGLLLLVGIRWGLVGTLTSFTVGHSVTLALATIGWVEVPGAPVEAAIALSILVLAFELARTEPGAPTWTRQHPGLMAAVFGLLHGLGFAGALAETGLPEDQLPMALLGFNLGVEAGQLAFVAVAIVGMLATRRAVPWLTSWGRIAVVYAMGSVAAFWCIERAFSMGT